MKSLIVGLVLFNVLTTAFAEVRDEMFFEEWMRNQSTSDYDRFLQTAELFDVIPIHQLLRTASDWEKCGGPPFEMPPRNNWKDVKKVLLLINKLQKDFILTNFEVVSGYRNNSLNRCAGGAPHSSHAERFAVDLILTDHPSQSIRLCNFWLKEGQRWNMGLSRYPSGRLHIDASGYRTWGGNYKSNTSYCKQK